MQDLCSLSTKLDIASKQTPDLGASDPKQSFTTKQKAPEGAHVNPLLLSPRSCRSD
jgi:hypothetical protein